VEALGGGAYRATIGPEWVLAMVPQGGVLAAIGARAMAAELETDLPLRAIHGVFASPVPDGPVDVRARVLRRGRSVSQASVDVTAPGAESGYTAVAVFGGDRAGFSFTELAMPDVPGPDGQPSFRDPPPRARVGSRTRHGRSGTPSSMVGRRWATRHGTTRPAAPPRSPTGSPSTIRR
jgi:hypothetical protein